MRTDYPATRRVLGGQHGGLDDFEVENLLEQIFPAAEPADVEDFMGALQGFGKQAAPLAKQALPGVIQGAKQGAMVGGPWGAVIGGLGGGAASVVAGQPGQGATPAVPAAPISASAASQQATANLLALLSRPETMQALLALLMAQSGRATVAVGGNPVPAHAFANAISETAARIAEYAEAPNVEGAATYLHDSAGAARCDIANPADRARVLLDDLAEQAAREADADEQFTEEELGEELAEGGTPDPLQAYLDVVEGRTTYAN